MGASGIPTDESIDCVGIGSGEATDRLLGQAANLYKAVNVGANRFQFARTFRPTWALVLGCVFAPVLVGLLFFLVKSTETWAATIEEDHRRVRVRVQGRILPQVLVAIREVLTMGAAPAPVAPSNGLIADAVGVPGHPAMPVSDGVLPPPVAPPPAAAATPSFAPAPAPAPAAAAPAPVGLSAPPPTTPPLTGVGAPPVGAPPPGPPLPGAPPPPASLPAPVGAPLGSAGPPAAPVLAEPLGGVDGSTVVQSPTQHRPASDQPVVAGPVELHFDTGLVEVRAGVVLVGRDPAAGPGEESAHLVALDDAGRAVSKTHLRVDVDADGAWVVDRGSTNGSVLVAADGTETVLMAGERRRAAVGDSVHFGGRTLRLQRGTA